MKSKMKTRFSSLVLILVLSLVSCNKKNAFKDFKYSDKAAVLDCKNKDLNPLLNEALFSFEEDINNFYKDRAQNLGLAYSRFVRSSINGRINLEEIASPHTVKIFEALKNEDLWDANNPNTYLSYNSDFFNCIKSNIKDENLKTTLNALLSTGSMSPKLYGTPVANKYRNLITDKYLASYIAFDLFYAKLFSVDLSKVTEKTEEIDFNKTK